MLLAAAATATLALATFTAAAPAPGLAAVAPVAPAVAVDPPPEAMAGTARLEAHLLRGGALDAPTDTPTPVETTCQTFKEFMQQTKETAKRMRGLGFAGDQIRAFTVMLLTDYPRFVVLREAGGKFCVPSEAFGEWIVEVYLAAYNGQLEC